MNRFARDLEAAHHRRWPGHPINLASRSLLLATSPGLQAILVHRIAQWLHLKCEHDRRYKRLWKIALIFFGLLNMATKINTKTAIRKDCEMEGGILLSDQGHIIFGARKTGARTVIGTRVTIGMSHADKGRPEIGRNVWIGSDCIVYGAINIGDGATLLPGTVLTKSIPAGVVMRGNPARLVLRDFDNSELLERQNPDISRYLSV